MSGSAKKAEKAKAEKKQDRLIAQNRKVFHDYEIFEKFEAGIELVGSEVRSLRDKNCQLKDTFVLIKNGEAWLYNLHISPFKYSSNRNLDSDRRRRLLLHKKELRKLKQETTEKGMSIIPLKIYFKAGHLVKIEIAIARGKKLYDKRADIAKKTQMREAQAYLKSKNQ